MTGFPANQIFPSDVFDLKSSNKILEKILISNEIMIFFPSLAKESVVATVVCLRTLGFAIGCEKAVSESCQ